MINQYGEEDNRIIKEMSILNNQLHNITRELSKKNLELEQAHKKITEDMEKAHILHRMFLPDSNLEIDNYSFATYYKPAYHLGGDFYNILRIKDKILFYLVDVSGHGLDGAILTIFIRETINKFLLFNQLEDKEPFSPSQILNYLADHYCHEQFSQDYFVCIIAAVVDLEENSLSLSNAGFQTEPFLVLPDDKLLRINISGPPISSAIDRQLFVFEETTTHISPQATTLFTTDGLIEEHKNGEMYGEERLAKVLRNYHQSHPHLIKNLIMEDFRSFSGSFQGKDDISFLIFKRRK